MARKPKYFDALLHALVAAGVMLMTCYPVITAGIVIAVFFAREMAQDINKGHVFPGIWPIRRSEVKDVEFAAPAIVAIIFAVLRSV